MGIQCGKPRREHHYRQDLMKKLKLKGKPIAPPQDSLYAQNVIRVYNESHCLTLVGVTSDKFKAPIQEINTGVSGTGYTEEDEFETYRYLSTPNNLVTFEPGQERTLSSENETAFVTLFQKKERKHKMLRSGQEEDFMVAICENHPVRIGSSVIIHDGWFEVFPENYVWEAKMGQTVEIQNPAGRGVYVKIDVDDIEEIDITQGEREGPWFCTNWYHKVYYRKYVPPGFSLLHREHMKWYLPNTKTKVRKLFVTVIRTDTEGYSTSRISTKEILVPKQDLKKRGGFVVRIERNGKIVPDCIGM